MRTTLDIESDILQVAKEIAAAEKSSAGAVLSKLARQGYQAANASKTSSHRNGIEMLPNRDEPVSLEHVSQLMDEEGI